MRARAARRQDEKRTKRAARGRGSRPAARRGRWFAPHLRAACLGLLLSLGALLPVSGLVPIASAHAFLVKSDPQAHALLRTPPPRVRLWYSEDVSPLTARVEVVDTANRQVDNHDARVSDDNPREVDIGLPLLRSGTYIVVWRVQSADDGHVTGGSFYFQIAGSDGVAPPIPATLPTGNIVGGGGAGNGAALDGPTWVQAAATWLALLFMTFWVGGIIWETWILPPGGQGDAELADAGRLAADRFRRLAPWALGGVLVADAVIVLAFSAELAGGWSGAVSPALLGAILFGSHYGLFWWMRQVVAGGALALALLERRGAPYAAAWRYDEGAAWQTTSVREPRALAEWASWSLAALRTLPAALARGWQRRSNWGRAMLLLGAALLVAFALSGHAAAVPTPQLPEALSVDLLHLLGNAAWAGGLFYIAVVLVPALRGLPARARAEVLARGLPHFSALALATVLILALTGSLNATIHLTSWQQFLTTAYGQTLVIKIELFVVMAVISYYHAFRLRPRLERALAAETALVAEPVEVALAGAGTGVGVPSSAGASTEAASGGIGANAQRLTNALADWLQREAAVGAAILVCVALLAAFAGTLAPATPAASSVNHLPYVSPAQVQGGLSMILTVDPNTAAATNTFTVTIHDTSGKPVDGAGVKMDGQMLSMAMSVQTNQLKPTGTPGTYSGQSDLDMGGDYQIRVGVLAPGAQTYLYFTFKFTAQY